MALTNAQRTILRNAVLNPGAPKMHIMDSGYTLNGYFSLQYAYARINRLMRRGLLEDRSDASVCAIYITAEGEKELAG